MKPTARITDRGFAGDSSGTEIVSDPIWMDVILGIDSRQSDYFNRPYPDIWLPSELESSSTRIRLSELDRHFEDAARYFNRKLLLSKSRLDETVNRILVVDIEPRSATSPENDTFLEQSKQVLSRAADLFSNAETVAIEPGMVNELSIGLELLIEEFGRIALNHIENLILAEKTSVSVAMEALKYIGSTESKNWYSGRRDMLENCLRKSRFAWIRDGAGLGLSFLDDPRSIPALEAAIDSEFNSDLKEDLVLVLEQLQETLSERR